MFQVCNNNPIAKNESYPHLTALYNDWRAERVKRRHDGKFSFFLRLYVVDFSYNDIPGMKA